LATPYDHYLSKNSIKNGKTVFPQNERRSFKGSSKQKKDNTNPKTTPTKFTLFDLVFIQWFFGRKIGSNYSGKRVSTSSKI